MELSLEGFKEYLSSLLISLLKAIWYPIDDIFYHLWSIIVYFYNVLVSFLQSIYGLLAAIKVYIYGSLSFLPSPWVAMLLVAVSVVVILRIYHFVKDIQIAGFKI